jgi:hypothetical protein
MKYRTALLLLLLAAPAAAQDYVMPRIPTEQEKVDALKLAYKINGNSMVGSQMIDLTVSPLPKADRSSLAAPAKLADMTPAEDAIWPALAPRTRADTCARVGMRKVITRGGKSWRCK